MASYSKFNIFVKDVNEKKHDLSADNLKIMLTLTAPVATNAVYADLTEIANGNGYTTGGTQATLVSSTQSSGTYKLILNQVTFTATSGSIANFRYAVLYNSTQTSPVKPLIGFWDYGSTVTITAGNSFLVALDQTNGVFTDT